MKKIKLLLTLSLVCLIIGCNNSSSLAPNNSADTGNNTLPVETTDNVELNIKEDSSDSSNLADTNNDNLNYQNILNQYIIGLNDEWTFEEYSAANLCYCLGFGYILDDIGYDYIDIDNNGIDELLIGEAPYEGYVGMIFDMYTLIDNKPQLVLSSGERDRYYLCDDNIISNEASNSATNSIWGYYEYLNGSLHLKEAVIYDSNVNSSSPWFHSTTSTDASSGVSVTEEDALSINDTYTQISVPYTSLEALNKKR